MLGIYLFYHDARGGGKKKGGEEKFQTVSSTSKLLDGYARGEKEENRAKAREGKIKRLSFIEPEGKEGEKRPSDSSSLRESEVSGLGCLVGQDREGKEKRGELELIHLKLQGAKHAPNSGSRLLFRGWEKKNFRSRPRLIGECGGEGGLNRNLRKAGGLAEAGSVLRSWQRRGGKKRKKMQHARRSTSEKSCWRGAEKKRKRRKRQECGGS